MRLPSHHQPTRARGRAWTLAIVLWAFGLATTTLLVGIWGRSVVSDEQTLAGSAEAALGADRVAERMYEWLAGGLSAASAAGSPGSEAALRAAAESPQAEQAVETIVGQVVTAAMAAPGAPAQIDVAAALEPLVPILRAELVLRGAEVSDDVVDETVRQMSTIVIDDGRAAGITGAVYRARTVLTRVTVAAIGALIVLGASAVALAEERGKMVRSLAIRLGVSSVTFALFLRIGAWAADPGGGRTPISTAGATLLASNSAVLFGVAAGSAAVAALAGWTVRRRRIRRVPLEPPSEAVRDELVRL